MTEAPKRPGSAEPSRPLENPRWEAVLQAFFKDPKSSLSDHCQKTGGYKAGPACHNTASRMMKNGEFSARLEWLQKQAQDSSIMTVIERKVMLSKIAREVGEARLCDYVEAAGGQAYVTYGPDSPRQGAVKKIKTVTMQNEDGNGATITTELEMHPPSLAIQAIRELNEMEGAHAPAKVAQTDTKGNDVQPWIYCVPPPKNMDTWEKWHSAYEKARGGHGKG